MPHDPNYLRHDRCTPSRFMRAHATRSPLLLLASKDKALQRQIRECLSGGGISTHSLILVRGESEWRKALSNERPRLVMLDDSVSSGDGLAWLTALHSRLPEALVIYVAEHHSLELERAVRQLGVLYYMGKPPDSSLLSRLLTSAFPSDMQTKKSA